MCRAKASDALRGRGIAKVRASPSRSRPAGMLTMGLGGGHYGFAGSKSACHKKPSSPARVLGFVLSALLFWVLRVYGYADRGLLGSRGGGVEVFEVGGDRPSGGI